MKLNIFKNISEIEFEGLNQEKILNKLSKNNKINNIIKNERNIKITVDYRVNKGIQEELLKNNFKIKKINNWGLFYLLNKLKKRLGIIFGIFFSLILIFIFNLFIYDFNIIGNNNINFEEVKTYFKDIGITPFTNKNKINTKELEEKLLQKFDTISSVSIIIKGSKLIINMQEKIINDEYENKENFVPLVSDFDAKLTKIKLIQGTLNVKEGQTVKKGDILVLPYIIDSNGNRKEIKPMAEITADVWYREDIKHQENKLEIVRTGKKQKTNQTSFMSIILKESEDCVYSKFEKQENSYCLLDIFPITYKSITYYEVEEKNIYQPFEEIKQKLIEDCKKNALLKVNECDIIKSEKESISGGAGVYFISYLITVSRNVGVYEN